MVAFGLWFLICTVAIFVSCHIKGFVPHYGFVISFLAFLYFIQPTAFGVMAVYSALGMIVKIYEIAKQKQIAKEDV